VSNFLTVHQHIIGYSMPAVGGDYRIVKSKVENLTNLWKLGR